jgi:DNA-binding response OmpR family regulator
MGKLEAALAGHWLPLAGMFATLPVYQINQRLSGKGCLRSQGRTKIGTLPVVCDGFVNFVFYDHPQTNRLSWKMRNILVIEDETDISDLVSLHLRDLGYGVEVVRDGVSGLQRARSGEFQLLILDLMLPGMNGLELCAKLRAEPAYTPVLMLTARSTEIDRIVGLETGADDYLTKPFSIHELLARVKAIFRRVDSLRGHSAEPSHRITCGDMSIDPDRRTVSVSGAPVELTAKEFDLLVQFAGNPGKVYSRKQLLDLVWGYQHDGYEHTVNSHINRLRSKIEPDPNHPRYVITVWGVGYKISDALGQPA